MSLANLKEPLNLFAIITKSPGYFVVDVGNQTVSEADGTVAAQIAEEHLTVLLDAKEFMKTERLAPSPYRRMICLATIKKLLAKSINTSTIDHEFDTPEDARAFTERALFDMFQRIDKRAITNLCALECQVIHATLAMEQRGVPFIKDRWQQALDRFSEEAAQVKEKLNSMLIKHDGFMLFGPEPIDLNNSNAVKEALETLVGKPIESTSQSSLKNIDHEAVKLLGTYREHTRMLSTYGENFLSKICDDRLHGTFVPIGSASGRFACHEPNLLALPNHPQFQACIEAKAPNTILHFDYGAFELRILAALSNDDALRKIFNDDLDIHSMVASAIFNQPVSKTEHPQLRDQAKILNFGLIYGMGEQSLAQQLNTSITEAKQLMRAYFKRFAQVGEFLESLESSAKKLGYAKTALGRRGYFPQDDTNKGYVGRVARNMPIQGTGADIVKLALCNVYKRFYDSAVPAHVINVVHDELVIECDTSRVDEVTMMVTEEMERGFRTILPNIKACVSVTS